MTLVETSVWVLILFIPLSGLQALLRVLVFVVDVVSIHDTHVVNTFRPLHPEVSD